MFYKKLDNGKYRYYEKYYNETEGKWKQVSVTLNSKSRQAQAQTKRLLEEKIESAEDTLFGFSGNITVSEILKEWLKIRQSELKESTYYSQLTIIKEFDKAFGQMLIRKVTSKLLQNFLLSHETWSPQYRNLVKVIINVFFKYCVKVGYIDENPLEKVVLPRRNRTFEELLLKSERFLNQFEMREYLNYLRAKGSHKIFNKVIEIMYLTGMRSGETLGLTWDVIDLDNKVIEVKQTLQMRGDKQGWYLSSPKTLSGYRTISISDRVVSILQELKGTSRTDLVFVTKNGNPFYLLGLNRYLQRTFKQSGVIKSENFKMTSHVLRHSHISLLAELNIPIRMIMDRVGHSEEKTTLQVYTHVTQGMKDSLKNKLEQLEI